MGEEINRFLFPITFEEAYPKVKEETDRFKITTSGVDHAGIVFRICQLLADRGINIIDMKTQRILSAESGPALRNGYGY